MFFQTKNNVPNVYANESRDFNIFEQIYDLAFNSCLTHANKINYIKSVNNIDASLLPKLATYLGFITTVHYPEKILRSILINYPDIIRNKGTSKAIRLAILSLQNAFTGINYLDVFVDSDTHIVEVVTDGVIVDKIYIEDLLKHVLPIGYIFGWIKVATPMNVYSAYRQQDLVVSVKFNTVVTAENNDSDNALNGGYITLSSVPSQTESIICTAPATGVINYSDINAKTYTITPEGSTAQTYTISEAGTVTFLVSNGASVTKDVTDIYNITHTLADNTINYLYNLMGHTKITEAPDNETNKDFSKLYDNVTPTTQQQGENKE